MSSPIHGSVRNLTGKIYRVSRFAVTKMVSSLIFVGLFIAVTPLELEARVFSFKNEGFVPYFKGGYYPSGRQNTALSESSTVEGVNLDYVDTFSADQSVEFGFATSGPDLTVRFGLEILRPTPIENETAKSESGVDLYSYTSEASAVIPKIVIEGHLKTFTISRISLFLGAGYANFVGRNSYVFLPDGQTQFGLVDFSEDLRSTATSLEAGLGWECLLSDTTTFQLDAGYRMLEFTEITYGKDVVNFQGSGTKGGVALNKDGSKRTLDLSGPFASISLKFYIF